MREYCFEIYGRDYYLHEGNDVYYNNRLHTQWQVRKLCEDNNGQEYYQQYRDALIPHRATKAAIQQHIVDYYTD